MIVVVLGALLMSALAEGVKRTYRTQDTHNLRQLAIAGTMYQDQWGDVPLSTKQLSLPKEMLSSKLDPIEGGYVSWLSPRKYKASWIGPGDLGWKYSEVWPEVKNSESAGWLIDVTSSRFRDGARLFEALEGPYRRVTSEGSLIMREHKKRPCAESSSGCKSTKDLFGDFK